MKVNNDFVRIFFVFIFFWNLNAQSVKSNIVNDTILPIQTAFVLPENKIENPQVLTSFFKKLAQLENLINGHVNIVHIGDSHIQADLMTHKIRKLFQEKFGNGGRGFVFPHSIAKTNGASDIKFSSNANWNAYSNIYPPNGNIIGLSGISLNTKFVTFALEILVKDPAYFFDSVTIITPNATNYFGFATTKKIVKDAVIVPKRIFYKIRKGETLADISAKVSVSIADLKEFNNLKSDKIKRGKTLKIPTAETIVKQEERSEYIVLDTKLSNQQIEFESKQPLEKIYLIPDKKTEEYNLNGLILKNKTSGVLYHNIGVNGAKFADYNKYPLFFEQLGTLSPDLFIVSLGTNESFGKFTTDKYLAEMSNFQNALTEKYPHASIIFTTPPPSLFKKQFPNLIVAEYASKMISIAVQQNFAVWNLHAQMGGVFGVQQNYTNGLVQPDKIHYTTKGYEMQGQMLFDALLNAYNDFKK